MRLRVVKSFNSTLRRFKVGDEIADDEDLAPLTVEDAKAAGLISATQSSVFRPSAPTADE